MNDRQEKILIRLRQYRKVRIHSLAEEFGVTEMTIRRDFRELEAKELLMQIKGGAVPYPVRYQPDTGTFVLTEEKFAIAEALYRAIMPLETLFLSTGSTTLAFASLLARHNRLPVTVITNSLPAASMLFRSRCKVILPGGELRTSSLDLVGPLTERNLEEYHVDWLVTGCDGAFADRGFYTSDESLSNLERKSVGIADRVAVLTESVKFGKNALTRFALPEDADILVTDSKLSKEDAAELTARSVKIIFSGSGKKQLEKTEKT